MRDIVKVLGCDCLQPGPSSFSGSRRSQAVEHRGESGGTRFLDEFVLGIVMGPQFAEMAANLGRNLLEGRVRLVQAIMARP